MVLRITDPSFEHASASEHSGQIGVKYQCGQCGHEFTAKEALCEDWREVENSFICPSCGCHLVKPRALPSTFRDWIREISCAIAIWFVAGLVLHTVQLVVTYLFGEGEIAMAAFLLVLLVLAFFLLSRVVDKPRLAMPIDSNDT